MGVPGLFANLSHKYKNYIIKKNIGDFTYTDILLFDFNCLIHPVCHLLFDEFSKKKTFIVEQFETKLMDKCIEYFELIIDFVSPTSIVGIFIDGCCPMSKLNQQRHRRFASILEKEIHNNIREKYKIEAHDSYDTNSITPGTRFMMNFDIYIKQYIKKKTKSMSSIHPEFIYSSYLDIGEGEHKIINFLNNHDMNSKNITIYGLDADLIILNMILYKKINKHRRYSLESNKIFLLRENDKFSFVDQDLIYFDIQMLCKCISYELKIKSKMDAQLFNIAETINYRLIDDFIFITMILGNDFIQPCPTVNMRIHKNKFNGYDLLIDAYKEISSDSYIIEWFEDTTFKINWNMFRRLIEYLVNYEQEYFEMLSTYKPYVNIQPHMNQADIQINKLNMLSFNYPDPIKMTKKEIKYDIRKKRYNHHYFGSKVCSCYHDNKELFSQLLFNKTQITNNFYDDKTLEINKNMLDNVIISYLNVFSYVLYYYYRGCPDYLYYYKYFSSPLLSDVYKYIENTSDAKLDNIMKRFIIPKNNNNLITPLVQLLLVLPMKSFHLLPTYYQKIHSH